MAGTRYYKFTSGFDQVTAPTGSTPSADEDFTTVGYSLTKFAQFVDTVANLKAVTAAHRTDQLPFYVEALEAWFAFDSGSSATGDDENVITPTAGTGRWLRIPTKGFGQSQDVATSATIAAMATSTPVVRLTGSTTTDLQGATAGVGNQILALYNASSAIVTVKHENASASAANRFSLENSRDISLKAGGAALFRYDKTLTRWVPAAGSGSGGGGMGGFPLKWLPDVGAPLSLQENFLQLWEFEAGLGQVIYAAYKVPASYVAGTALSMRFQWYSAGTSGNVLLKTTSTLIRSATDAVSSTTNQRTSTNSAVTLSAGTVNEPQTVAADITSATGTINSVAVSAGDLIIIKLERDSTDTATATAKLIADSAEVSET